MIFKKKKAETEAKEKASVLTQIAKYVTVVLVVLVLFWFGFVCQVREGSCAVILRFGAVRQEVTEAGVYLKLPWPFETVVSYDTRLQYLESNKLETTTSDKRNIILQSYVVWRIHDPVLYHNSVGSQGTVESYIKDQVFSATNSTMGGYKLTELVSLEKEEIKIDQIQQDIFQRVHDVCQENYGIEVTDVSILRLSLPEDNLQSVFAQMVADREKEISAILSEAQLEAKQIETDAMEQAAQITAQGTTDAAKIDAETETLVAEIYAEAQSANVELYQFLMDLDTMVNSVNGDTILVVKADQYPFNVLLKYSQNMNIEGNNVAINDLTYIMSQMTETERVDLTNALVEMIRQNSRS